MKTEIENIIYNYADEIPHIFIRVINAITLSNSKEELRSAINKIELLLKRMGSQGILYLQVLLKMIGVFWQKRLFLLKIFHHE